MTGMNDAVIRAGRPADREGIVRLLAAQMAEHSIAISRERLTSAVDGVFEDPRRGALLVALIDEKPAGVAYLAYTFTIEHGGKSAWLEELYVSPEHREKGLGQRLLDEALRLARREMCAALDLEVESDHKRVESLYRRSGFRPHTRSRWVAPLR
jgi:GNAT superfamily N-acetyltransferase